jgi:hypothetical protein
VPDSEAAAKAFARAEVRRAMAEATAGGVRACH